MLNQRFPVTKVLIAVGVFAGFIGMAVEAVARGEGAGPFPTAEHNVAVHFHATPTYVTSAEASVYHAALAVFLTCWAFGLVCVALKKLAHQREARP